MRTVELDLIDPSPFADLDPPNEENIERMAADFRKSAPPAVDVIQDGERWELLAGHDRVEAARRAGLSGIAVRSRTGTIVTDREKVSFGGRENNQRKDPDKRPRIEWMLRDDPGIGNQQVADELGCDHSYVWKVRKELEDVGELLPVNSSVGKDGKKRPTHYKPRTPKASTDGVAATGSTSTTEGVESSQRELDPSDGPDPRLTDKWGEVKNPQAEPDPPPVPLTKTYRGKDPLSGIRSAVGVIAGLVTGFKAWKVEDCSPSGEEAREWETELATARLLIGRFIRDLREYRRGQS